MPDTGQPHGPVMFVFDVSDTTFLVCARANINNPSEQYLAEYLGGDWEVPPISFDCMMKAAGLIEKMSRPRWMKPRKPHSSRE